MGAVCRELVSRVRFPVLRENTGSFAQSAKATGPRRAETVSIFIYLSRNSLPQRTGNFSGTSREVPLSVQGISTCDRVGEAKHAAEPVMRSGHPSCMRSLQGASGHLPDAPALCRMPRNFRDLRRRSERIRRSLCLVLPPNGPKAAGFLRRPFCRHARRLIVIGSRARNRSRAPRSNMPKNDGSSLPRECIG